MRSTFVRAAVVAALSLVWAADASAAPNNNTSGKLRHAVTLDGVQQHLSAFQGIAEFAGGNRFAGLAGHDASAAYVIAQLEDAGYEPTIFEFTYNAFFEVTPSVLERVAPSPATYVNGNDFRVMSYSGSGDTTAPLEAPSGDVRGCYPADFAGFAAGSIALVQRGTPAGFPGGSCSFRIKTDNAIAAGASAVLVFNNTAGVLNGTLGEPGGLSAIPSLGLTQSLGEQLMAMDAANPVTMRVRTNTGSQPLDTYNVLAETPGDAGNVVMAGAHLDSVTAGPGVNDNGSGSAALLETAIQMAKVKPRNKVRFAWWSAEESGLVGATRYVASLNQAQGDAIALYLNFDMVGSPNFARMVYDGDNSTGTGVIPAGCQTRCTSGSGTIESVFNGYFEQVAELPSESTPFNGRSDYGPFIAANIPSGGLFTGAEGIKTPAQAALYGGVAGAPYDPCYHAACDTEDNVSAQAMDEMSDAIAHAVITFAQNTAIVNGVKGKGNFKRPARSTGGTTDGGAGGLHDEHDHDED